MKLVTNEMTGMFLLPMSGELAAMVWEVLNSVGVIFVPFIILIIRSFFTAKAQGLDEGSPAVLAIKLLEKSFWVYVIVIIFVLLPITGQLKVEHRQYACADNPSLLNNDYSSAHNTTANRRVLDVLGANGGTSPSLWVGLVHQLSVGITETAVSKLSCQQGVNASDIAASFKNQIPQTESVYLSIQSFHEQCYNPAKTIIHKAIADSETLRSDVSRIRGWDFWPPSYDVGSELMRQTYHGEYLYDRNVNPITMDVPSHWFNNDISGKNLLCYDMAKSLYDKIERDIEDSEHYETDKNRFLAFAQLTNELIDESVIKHDMIMNVYSSVFTPKQEGEARWEAERKASSSFIPSFLSSYFDKRAKEQQELLHEMGALNSLGYLDALSLSVVKQGAIATSIVESAKGHAVVLMMPIIITLLQTVLMMALPIIAVMTSYSMKVIYHWSVFYFAITMSQFWITVGTQIETLLLSLLSTSHSVIERSSDVLGNGYSESLLVTSIAYSFVYITPIVWVMMIQIVAQVSAIAMTGAIGSAANIGGSGAQVIFNRTKELASRTRKGFARGKGKLMGG